MSKICIFAGTAEGRKLAQVLAGRGASLTVCTATEYGAELVGSLKDVRVLAGKMPADDILNMLQEERFDVCVDATHPYAAHITESIRGACEKSVTSYLRLQRESTAGEEDGIFVEDAESCAAFLKGTAGNILLTTGSKTLPVFCADEALRERLYARVLPLEASLKICSDCGLPASRIYAIQGPFSEEMNAAMIRQCGASYVVTKDTGLAGGYEEKIAAAAKCGAKVVIIGRPPQTEGVPFAEASAMLEQKLGLSPRLKRVHLIGIGMDGENTLTAQAQRAIRASDVLIGAPRMLAPYDSLRKQPFKAIKSADIADFIASSDKDTFAVLFSGDTGFYSGAKALTELLKQQPNVQADILPGIGSLSYFCAKIGRTWQDVKAVSLHGRDMDLARSVRENPAVFALLGGKTGAQDALQCLEDAGLGGLFAWTGENLGYPEEKISSGTVSELLKQSFDSLCVLLVENPFWRSCTVTHGLSDDMFDRSAVPMTKQEVRSVCLSKLRLGKGSVVWDVGAGSGSVSVECALQAAEGMVFAVEKEEDACALTRHNAQKLGARNVDVIHASAPEGLADLPSPTHVFIGGSSGSMEDILRVILEKNPHARIVATAVTMETAAELTALSSLFSFSEICCLNVSRGKKLGRYQLMTAQNPVYIFTLQN
ncbi:MAG: precorrin-6A reductase [Clostridia bacterium]|nr:precorrin-6A reductase [Clostridia bacterium]